MLKKKEKTTKKEKLTFTFETDVLSLQGGSKGAKK